MKLKSQRLLFIVASLISITIATTIILIEFSDQLVFFYTPTQLKTANLESNKKIRIGGLIKEGSIIHKDGLKVEFIVTDLTNETLITYEGITPDLFKEGQGMVAIGYFDSHKNLFIADSLLAKHDENYMPPEVASSLKK